jgi:AcrR family transcriptional regulator
MPPTRREKQYAATSAEIKATARALMAEHGTAGVSLRAIARAMEMSAPSLYHYFPSYDDLITALISDAFHALADALERTRDQAAGPPIERLLAVTLAYRDWALAHPLDFQLIYGNPIPGYVAPRELTVPAAARSLGVFAGLIAEALANGASTGQDAHVPAGLRAHLEALREHEGYDVPLAALYLGVVGWTRIHGIIMLELFQHIQPVVGDIALFYRIQVEDLLKMLGPGG